MPRYRYFWLFCIFGGVLSITGCASRQALTSCATCPQTVEHFVYTANAAGSPSTLSALQSKAATGALSSISGSPYSTGLQSVALAKDPKGAFLYVSTANSDDISAFNTLSSGAVSPVAGSPFAAELGIGSIAIDPAGTFLYAVTGNSGNLWAYSINPSTGALSPLVGIPMAIAPPGALSSVVIDNSGKYLYVTNGNSLAPEIYGFSRDATTGALTPLPGFPGGLYGFANTATFDPTGKFLLVTGTNTSGIVGGVEVLTLDPSTGHLGLAPGSPFPYQVGVDPAGVVVDASGKYVYIPNTADATISAFSLDNTSGALTAVPNSPFPSGGIGNINGPLGIARDDFGHFVFVCNASNDISVFSISGNGALTPVSGSPFADGGNGPSAIISCRKGNDFAF
jgi:6-phosphogluconolactonase